MDPSILKALLCMHELTVNYMENEDECAQTDLGLISAILTYCTTVDECVHVLKGSGLEITIARLQVALELAYSKNVLICAEILIKWCVMDQDVMDYVMRCLIDENNYVAAKHFIACGYNMRFVTSMFCCALNQVRWLKLLMEDAGGMHLLFKGTHQNHSLLRIVRTEMHRNNEVRRYLRQLQFLSSFIILTSQQRHSHFHKRGRMDGKQPMKKMPLDMFRLIGAMLVY